MKKSRFTETQIIAVLKETLGNSGEVMSLHKFGLENFSPENAPIK